MNDFLLKKLVAFGLSEKEAQIYLALLELEVATAFQVAKYFNVNRSSAYVVLESLKRKGLVGISHDKKVRRYVATSPDTLLDIAHHEVKKTEEVKNGLESIIPDLKTLYKGTKRKPVIRMFEGPTGIKEIFNDFFKGKIATDLKAYADADMMFRHLPGFKEFIEKRAALGIKMYAINPATKEMMALAKHNPPPRGDEFALIPKSKFNFPVHVGIYGDRVSFMSMDGSFGIIIESRDIAATMRNSFDLSWEEAKRLNKIIRKKQELRGMHKSKKMI